MKEAESEVLTLRGVKSGGNSVKAGMAGTYFAALLLKCRDHALIFKAKSRHNRQVNGSQKSN
jgi:hypothetical protein